MFTCAEDVEFDAGYREGVASRQHEVDYEWRGMMRALRDLHRAEDHIRAIRAAYEAWDASGGNTAPWDLISAIRYSPIWLNFIAEVGDEKAVEAWENEGGFVYRRYPDLDQPF